MLVLLVVLEYHIRRRKESDQGVESSLLGFNPLRGSSGEGNQSQGVKSTFLARVFHNSENENFIISFG